MPKIKVQLPPSTMVDSVNRTLVLQIGHEKPVTETLVVADLLSSEYTVKEGIVISGWMTDDDDGDPKVYSETVDFKQVVSLSEPTKPAVCMSIKVTG